MELKEFWSGEDLDPIILTSEKKIGDSDGAKSSGSGNTKSRKAENTSYQLFNLNLQLER